MTLHPDPAQPAQFDVTGRPNMTDHQSAYGQPLGEVEPDAWHDRPRCSLSWNLPLWFLLGLVVVLFVVPVARALLRGVL